MGLCINICIFIGNMASTSTRTECNTKELTTRYDAIRVKATSAVDT